MTSPAESMGKEHTLRVLERRVLERYARLMYRIMIAQDTDRVSRLWWRVTREMRRVRG